MPDDVEYPFPVPDAEEVREKIEADREDDDVDG